MLNIGWFIVLGVFLNFCSPENIVNYMYAILYAMSLCSNAHDIASFIIVFEVRTTKEACSPYKNLHNQKLTLQTLPIVWPVPNVTAQRSLFTYSLSDQTYSLVQCNREYIPCFNNCWFSSVWSAAWPSTIKSYSKKQNYSFIY